MLMGRIEENSITAVHKYIQLVMTLVVIIITLFPS